MGPESPACRGEKCETAFAASIQVDLSGSMGSHVQSAALYDATMVLSDTFAGLSIAPVAR